MLVSFKQIRSDKNISEKGEFETIIIPCLILLGLTVFLIKSLHVHPLIVGISALGAIWFGKSFIRKYYSDWIKKKDVIGEIIFERNMISFVRDATAENIDINDIVEIDLHYNYIQGKQFAYKDIIHNGLAQIKIGLKSGSTTTIKFIIEQEEQLDKLKPIWEELYNSGITIKEKMGKYEHKTILFEIK